MNWQEIDKAANDGSLDKAELPFLLQCRQELDRLANAGDPSFQRVIKALRNRVGELIKVRELEQLQSRNAEADQKRHAEITSLQQKAVQVSKEANRISAEANKISKESNETSKEANRISRGAKGEARIATAIALVALILSGVQCFLDWHYKSAKVNQTSLLAPLQLKKELNTPPTNNAPLSIATNATSPNSIPSKTLSPP